MTFSTITRVGAAALVLALTPVLAFAAAPSEPQVSATHDCTHRDCACAKSHANRAAADAATQAREREANGAFLKQVWTAP